MKLYLVWFGGVMLCAMLCLPLSGVKGQASLDLGDAPGASTTDPPAGELAQAEDSVAETAPATNTTDPLAGGLEKADDTAGAAGAADPNDPPVAGLAKPGDAAADPGSAEPEPEPTPPEPAVEPTKAESVVEPTQAESTLAEPTVAGEPVDEPKQKATQAEVETEAKATEASPTVAEPGKKEEAKPVVGKPSNTTSGKTQTAIFQCYKCGDQSNLQKSCKKITKATPLTTCSKKECWIFGNGNGSYARGCMDSSSPKMKEFKKCSAFKVKECRTIKTGTKKQKLCARCCKDKTKCNGGPIDYVEKSSAMIISISSVLFVTTVTLATFTTT